MIEEGKQQALQREQQRLAMLNDLVGKARKNADQEMVQRQKKIGQLLQEGKAKGNADQQARLGQIEQMIEQGKRQARQKDDERLAQLAQMVEENKKQVLRDAQERNARLAELMERGKKQAQQAAEERRVLDQVRGEALRLASAQKKEDQERAARLQSLLQEGKKADEQQKNIARLRQLQEEAKQQALLAEQERLDRLAKARADALKNAKDEQLAAMIAEAEKRALAERTQLIAKALSELERGLKALKAGNLEVATTAINNAARFAPDEPRVVQGLRDLENALQAAALAAEKAKQAVVQQALQAIPLGSTAGPDVSQHLDAANKHLAARRYADAIREFQTVLNMVPNHPAATEGLRKAKAGKK